MNDIAELNLHPSRDKGSMRGCPVGGAEVFHKKSFIPVENRRMPPANRTVIHVNVRIIRPAN